MIILKIYLKKKNKSQAPVDNEPLKEIYLLLVIQGKNE